MMENNNLQSPLVGSEIHGFRIMGDLDVGNMMEEAKARWLRPNEIHAVLFNHKYFTVNVKPVNLPKSGRILLFDRKMLRNFRKDGHNWKKKKDGKTVKEAHEHLKVGNEERIHVYYAHGQDNPTFVRRCYWLLDKSLEHIVLVHYRETQELQGSPATPGNSNSSSGLSEPSAFWPFSEDSDNALDQPYSGGRRDSLTVNNHEQKLHEINTLEWDELLAPDDSQNPIIGQGKTAGVDQLNQYQMSSNRIYSDESSEKRLENETILNSQTMNSGMVPLGALASMHNLGQDGLEAQDSYGKWMTCISTDDFQGSADDQALDSSISNAHQSFTSGTVDNQVSAEGQIFNITDVSPAWALSTEETKILVVGFFNGQIPLSESKLFISCGESFLPVEVVQAGVLRCFISPQTPGPVNLYLTFDGQNPISQVLTYEFRSPVVFNGTVSLENHSNWDEFKLNMRLARLLFSSNCLNIFSTKLAQNALKKAKAFTQKTSHISDGWVNLTKMIGSTKLSFPQAKESFFELILQNRLQEWLLEQVVAGCKITERDEQGQGVIHLCAILGYTWAVYPYDCSGLSLDYRDKCGWTALHWAAYYGREKMVATLLSAGSKPNLVTDPTSENRGGCTAADLASINGHDGLSAYLAEKALVAQFDDMSLAGNASGSLQITRNDTVNLQNITEDELYLKDTLAAYRTAADAAARIHSAFREHSLNIQTQIVESSNPELVARNIVAAMKIQHAFRNFDTRKKVAAAANIQYRFRTWKIRKDFLNMRRQTIKIQSIFRGFQHRRQYKKIVWSLGILEKAILRWRLKRKGFRGHQVQESDVEDGFFEESRKQAEERVEKSIVKVQGLFRSKRAQEEYRRMKMEHSKATLEYERLVHPDFDMR